MLDMTRELGREVATTTEILQVIRPEMRLARYQYRGMLDAMREGWLDATEDMELRDGGDAYIDERVFECILTNALTSVRQWAKDVGKVFDGPVADEFIRQAICAAMVTRDGVEQLPPDALDY